jgi:glycine oxidase
MPAATSDVVVIGAGIIGCTTARALAAEGMQVLVLERSRVAAESSGAAAGILAPRVHATEGAMFPLAIESHSRYARLVEELRDETGLDVEYARSGVLDLAYDEAREEELRDKVQWLQGLGHDVSWLDREAVLAEEASLSPDLRGAFFDGDAYHVNPTRLTTAIAQSAARRGVTFQMGHDVLGIHGSDGRATTILTTAGEVFADRVVIATGAWTSHFDRWLGLPIPVFPARGQILTVTAVPPPLHAIVFGLEGYLLPRLDGTVVVGATVEHVGYDKGLTAGGVAWLLNTLGALCPALANAPLDRIWTGLRPGSPDDLPIVGRPPGWENVTIATGHYRNGIMLAPITAQLVADLVTRGATNIVGADAVSPARFIEQ